MRTIPDRTTTCGSAKQLCCRSPISVTIHANTVWQFLAKDNTTPIQVCLRSIDPTSAVWHSSKRSVWKHVALLSCWRTSCPACQTTGTVLFLLLLQLRELDSATAVPVSLSLPCQLPWFPGVTAGLPPHFFVHCTRKSTCLGSAVQKKPGPPCSGRFSV